MGQCRPGAFRCLRRSPGAAQNARTATLLVAATASTFTAKGDTPGAGPGPGVTVLGFDG
ncbi:MAG: hypothetical protein WDN49_02845 [Acetobacteraceae bacterium]